MSNVLFKRREREIGNAVEIVARKGCNEILEKEKKKAETESQNQGEKDGLVGIAVSYDMGWQKRGRVITPSQVMVRQWGLSQAKFYHMQPGASPAGFVTLVKGQERQLKIMTTEKIMQVLLSQWRGM